jgi:hypothetical protein
MSESHQRQMAMFSENSTKFMDEFSKEFEDGMMEIIRRKARSQRQNANQLYRDYIADKQHFHMNGESAPAHTERGRRGRMASAHARTPPPHPRPPPLLAS